MQSLIVYDHTHPDFLRRRRVTNGAETMSVDLVNHQLPNWRRWVGEYYADRTVLLSTCPLLTKTGDLPQRVDLVVQYLHSFPFANPILRQENYLRKITAKADRYIFISAYEAYTALLAASGHEVYYRHMAIDPSGLPAHNPIHDNRILWFGRVDKKKQKCFDAVRVACESRGLGFDYISHDMFNDTVPVTQAEAWRIAAGYKYGIAVGRCALEMMSIGLRVLVAGRSVGGLIMNEDDWARQLSTNLNGRVVTFSSSIHRCLDNIGTSRSGRIVDIRDVDHTAGLR